MPGGRPSKYIEEFAPQAQELCENGATVPELARFFSVATTTITDWANRYDEFACALRVGREIADARVERSLYDRAVGFTFDKIQLYRDAPKFDSSGKLIDAGKVTR